MFKQAPRLTVALFFYDHLGVFDKDAIGSEKKTNMGFIEVASKAKELLIEFLDVQWKLIRDVQPKCQVKWNPPSEGM